MVRRPSLACIAALVAAGAAPPALAQEAAPGSGWIVELSPQIAYLRGDTTYRIEASDGASSVASELKFPIGVQGVGLQARFAGARERGRGGAALEVGGLVSIHQGRGTMKDSDWISGPAEIVEVGAPHEGKDIYSESKADGTARVLDARVAWEFDAFAPGVVLAPMFGLLYQRLEYQVRDGEQWGYGPWQPGYTGTFSGRALDYRVRYLVPYVGGRAALQRGSFRGQAEVWASPVAGAEDEDDHLLRSKLSTTDASGSALSASVGAGFAVGPRGTLQARASLLRVRATGSQRQRFYAGPDAGLELRIPSTITSAQAAFGIAYTHAL